MSNQHDIRFDSIRFDSILPTLPQSSREIPFHFIHHANPMPVKSSTSSFDNLIFGFLFFLIWFPDVLTL